MRQLLALLTALPLATPAFALDCPVQAVGPSYIDDVNRAIKTAKTCEDGAQIAEACAMVSSGDAAIAPTAERKCGLDFWKKLTAADKKIYDGLQAKCAAKYKGMDGTMWISASAFCRLNVARLYSELYSRPDDADR